MLFFTRFLLVAAFGAEIFFFVKIAIEYNKRYKAFVDFLRLENDRETLKAIGYEKFYGEEYGLRKTVSTTDALLQLYARYKQTQNPEYLEYADYLEKKKKRVIPLIASWIIAFFLLSLAFGEY